MFETSSNGTGNHKATEKSHEISAMQAKPSIIYGLAGNTVSAELLCSHYQRPAT